jgi:phosphoribosylformylglycinamidine synthase
MKAAVIVFPGSNCDRDVAVALAAAAGQPPRMVWHRDTALPEVDLIVLPGGFSYGDYLRAGAMAAQSPVLRAVVARARAGVAVLGICNGFQVLTECGLLPGALMRNRHLRFLSRPVHLKVEATATPYTAAYEAGQVIRVPIAHHDGCYHADADTLDRLEGEGRVVFRYVRPGGAPAADEDDEAANPNGSARAIAGIADPSGRILGLMPHPERAAEPAQGGTDGRPLFQALVRALG